MRLSEAQRALLASLLEEADGEPVELPYANDDEPGFISFAALGDLRDDGLITFDVGKNGPLIGLTPKGRAVAEARTKEGTT